jgi:hypothetical protein
MGIGILISPGSYGSHSLLVPIARKREVQDSAAEEAVTNSVAREDGAPTKRMKKSIALKYVDHFDMVSIGDNSTSTDTSS